MVDLSVSNDIEASAPAVWKTLTDLKRFREWNPFIRYASGKPAVGAKLFVRVKPKLRLPLFFRPTVLVCDENKELRWKGHFLRPWIGSGEHSFTLESTADGKTRFVQREVFRGILPALFARVLEREVRQGFEAMNAALKTRAEQDGRKSS